MKNKIMLRLYTFISSLFVLASLAWAQLSDITSRKQKKGTVVPFLLVLYIKNCGIDPATCAELESEFTVESEKTPPTITISGASNGATYFMPVSLTITYSVTDDKDPNPTVTANYPSGHRIRQRGKLRSGG